MFDVSKDMLSKSGTDFFADYKPYAYYRLLFTKYIESDNLSKVMEMSSAFSLLSNKKCQMFKIYDPDARIALGSQE